MEKDTALWSANQFMTSRTYELHHFFDRELEASPLHTHEYYEIYFFVRGSVDFTIEKGHYLLMPGDIILISPRNLHKVVLTFGTIGYERIVIRLDSKYIKTLSTPRTDLSECFKLSSELSKQLVRDEALSESINRYIFEMSEADGEYGEDVLCEIKLKSILLELAVYFRGENTQKSESSLIHNSSAVISAVEYINDNLEGDLSLDTIAKNAYVSKYHLVRLFKTEMGISPHQYILKKRLILAKGLIETGAKISEVYLNCGFSDYTHFFRAFKACYGMTPKEYFERIRK